MVDDEVEFEPESLPVEYGPGADEPGVLFSPEVQQAWDAWLTRWERHLYPVFAARGISQDAALVAFMTNLAYSALRDIRVNTYDTASLLEDEADDWGPGANPVP